jgi:hypothetical protein
MKSKPWFICISLFFLKKKSFSFLKKREIRKSSFQIAVTRSLAIRVSKAAPSQDVGT